MIGRRDSQQQGESLTYRSFSIGSDEERRETPSTVDREARSLEVVAATESPVPVLDWERFEVVPEVLLMEGAKIPKRRKIPLLDSHTRGSVVDVLGSARNLRTERGQLIADTFFSATGRAVDAFDLVADGHVEDFSIGYRVNQHIWIEEGKKKTVRGREFTGPLRVVTDWTPRELSITAIGADELAKARSFNGEGNETMDKRLRAYLETRGLAADATEEQAWAFLNDLRIRDSEGGQQGDGQRQGGQQQEPQSPQEPRGPDLDQVRAEAARVEQERISEIRALCDRFGVGELAQEMISQGRSVADAQKAVLEQLRRKPQEDNPGYRGLIEIGVEAGEKFRMAAIDSLVLRAGVSLQDVSPGARELAAWTLRELAREALRMAGRPIGGNVLDMVGRAMTTSDFPYILAAGANRSLFEGWDGAEETWSIWCGTGSVPDFKQIQIVRASEFDDLEEIPEAAEYKYGARTEAKEAVQIVTYGKMFAITRQAIINDDLGALTDIPRGHGEAAARKVGDLPYAVLTANANMGDNNPLFDNSNHSNVGTSGVVGVTTIGEAIKLMGLQMDIGGKRRLNIRPQFFLGPRTIEGACEVFFKSMQFADEATPGTPDEAYATSRVNPYAGSYFTRIYEGRLDDDDVKAWYLAGPKGKTVKVYFLNGNQRPYMEERTGWSVDGIEYKVRIDAAAKAVDWRGLVSNAGG